MTVPSALTGVLIGARAAIPGYRGAHGDLESVVTAPGTRSGVMPAQGKGHREPESHHRGIRTTNGREQSNGPSREDRERRERSRGSNVGHASRSGSKSEGSGTTGDEVRRPRPLPGGPLPDEERLFLRSRAPGEAWPEEVHGSCRPKEQAIREGCLGAEGWYAQRGAAGKSASAKRYGSRTTRIPDERAHVGPAS